jgi:hypothetical protein
VLDPWVDHDATARLIHSRTVGSEDPRLRDRRKSRADPEVEAVQRGGAELDENLAGAGLRIGRVLVAKNFRPAVLVDANCLHSSRL